MKKLIAAAAACIALAGLSACEDADDTEPAVEETTIVEEPTPLPTVTETTTVIDDTTDDTVDDEPDVEATVAPE